MSVACFGPLDDNAMQSNDLSLTFTLNTLSKLSMIWSSRLQIKDVVFLEMISYDSASEPTFARCSGRLEMGWAARSRHRLSQRTQMKVCCLPSSTSQLSNSLQKIEFFPCHAARGANRNFSNYFSHAIHPFLYVLIILHYSPSCLW